MLVFIFIFQISGTNKRDKINDQSDPEFSNFLKSKIKNGAKIEINMDELLGIGGESIVIKQKNGKDLRKYLALKLMPLDRIDENIKKSVEEDQNEENYVENNDSSFVDKFRLSIGMNPKKINKEKPNNIINAFDQHVLQHPESKSLVQQSRNGKSAPTESENVRNSHPEFECSSLNHPNVIGYDNVTLDIVDNYLALIAGKNNIIQLLFYHFLLTSS